MAPVFKLLSTTGEQSIDLQPGRNIVVGRAVTSDVPIYDPTISRRHAEVSLTDGGVKVKDAGSSNGTFLNGARITEAIAVENDVITFGKVAFRVKEVSAPVARPQVVPSVSAEFTGAKPAGGTIEVMVFGRDRTDLVAWAQARLGAPRGRCSLDGNPLQWWRVSGTTVTLTEPPPGSRARELVIRAGGGAPPGCA